MELQLQKKKNRYLQKKKNKNIYLFLYIREKNKHRPRSFLFGSDAVASPDEGETRSILSLSSGHHDCLDISITRTNVNTLMLMAITSQR